MKIVKNSSELLAFNLITKLDEAMPIIGEELRPLVGARRGAEVVGPPDVVKVCKILHNSQIFICACTTDGPNVVQK